VVAGQDRHHPRPAAAHVDDDTAGAAGDVAAADAAQAGADQPGTGPQADQPGRPHPPRQGGLGVRERQVAGDLRGTIGGLAPLPGQRRVRGSQCGNDTAGQKPQVGAQRAARRAGQARSADREPPGHRGMQQHLRDRIQAQADRVISELARRPQQALRPLPAARRHHYPGEIRRLWRHRGRLPSGDQPAVTAPGR
jgi:hypothetical protein